MYAQVGGGVLEEVEGLFLLRILVALPRPALALAEVREAELDAFGGLAKFGRLARARAVDGGDVRPHVVGRRVELVRRGAVVVLVFLALEGAECRALVHLVVLDDRAAARAVDAEADHVAAAAVGREELLLPVSAGTADVLRDDLRRHHKGRLLHLPLLLVEDRHDTRPQLLHFLFPELRRHRTQNLPPHCRRHQRRRRRQSLL
mmetsp:Transcript_19968/g.64318  ORF Transcript_19968/g.64318 Transcript_19968/m.64318 type:complete len:204 (+) Transcript_19968:1075-1686(+)